MKCSFIARSRRQRRRPCFAVTLWTQGGSGRRLCPSSVTMKRHRSAPHFAPATEDPCALPARLPPRAASPHRSPKGPQKAALFGIKRLTRTFHKPNKGGPYDDRV